MITVEEALARVFALCTPLPHERVALEDAAGRVMVTPAIALRDQPPFSASAMDGYALAGPAQAGARLRVIGEAGAGHAFAGRVGAGEAVRIFTGAPLPEGTDRVVIQEDVTREGDEITLNEPADPPRHVRPRGADFAAGDRLCAPRRLRPVDLALLAAMNVPEVTVSRRPEVAIIATGDELVLPGQTPRDDQIVASNSYALKAMAEAEGAQARLLPIARDSADHLRNVIEQARGADVILTIGGASVGDHDLVAPVTAELGASRAFYKLAMRPGKPLMAGRLFEALMLGLPGNPVSAIVTATLFLRPALRAMQGMGAWPLPTRRAILAEDMPANGPRAHYMRAKLEPEGRIRPANSQDSALLGVLAQADALLVRPVNDPARAAGSEIRYIPLDD